MHHLLAVLFGALSGAISATVPIYAAGFHPPEDLLATDESVVV